MRLMKDIDKINRQIRKMATWVSGIAITTFLIIAGVGYVEIIYSGLAPMASIFRNLVKSVLILGIILSILIYIGYMRFKKEKPAYKKVLILTISGPVIIFMFKGMFSTEAVTLASFFMFMLFAAFSSYLYGMSVVLKILSKKYAVNNNVSRK